MVNTPNRAIIHRFIYRVAFYEDRIIFLQSQDSLGQLLHQSLEEHTNLVKRNGIGQTCSTHRKEMKSVFEEVEGNKGRKVKER